MKNRLINFIINNFFLSNIIFLLLLIVIDFIFLLIFKKLISEDILFLIQFLFLLFSAILLFIKTYKESNDDGKTNFISYVILFLAFGFILFVISGIYDLYINYQDKIKDFGYLILGLIFGFFSLIGTIFTFIFSIQGLLIIIVIMLILIYNKFNK